jgi:dihydrofolate reductase
MNQPKISLIAAVAKNLAIGKNNQLLWHIPEDFKHFKEKTKGHVVIMGSRTFESLGKPLPNRTNIVIASDKNYQAPGCIMVHSVDEAVVEAKKVEEKETFVIGGGSIYKQFLPLADKLYITLIDKEYEADTFFPPYDEFKKITQTGEGEYKGLKYKFLELER